MSWAKLLERGFDIERRAQCGGTRKIIAAIDLVDNPIKMTDEIEIRKTKEETAAC